MKIPFIALLSVLLLSICLAQAQDAASDYPWQGAVAKADITPTELGWMSGYASRKGPAEKVLQPIFAKALALRDADGGQFVFVTMDLIGVSRSFRDEIAALAEEKHGVPPEALLLNASHTHSSPMTRLYEPPGGGAERPVYANIPEDEQELRVRQTKDYLEDLVETVDGLIGEALSNLAPVTVSWSHSRCGFAMNRRTPAGPGAWKNSPNPDAPVDHEVPVLQVRSKESGDLEAVMFGYACHATTLSIMEISGDWPGYAQHIFEAEHPGTVAMFLNGCSGDQNPYPRRMLPYVERHGRSMATAIEAALETPAEPVSGPIRSALEWPEIRYQEPPTREELEEKAESEDRFDARHARFLLDVLKETGGLPESYPVPVQVVRFGDSLTVAAIGGEVVVDYSLRLKRELGDLTGGAPVWVAGYSNDVMTYIPSRRVLEEGGYEGGKAMRHVRSTVHPAPWEPAIEERLVGKIKELVEATGKGG
ncbi:MAG: neutral/alkaline non-lysosomal ceramidase N-terminal domain-containing protein [Verrucomicrobiales bacterium]